MKLSCAVLALVCVTLPTLTVRAASTWHCGDADSLEVTLHQTLVETTGVLDGPGLAPVNQSRQPIELTCSRMGSDSGYLWACRSPQPEFSSLRVSIFRGNHTGDPWASAWVTLGDWRLEHPLECTVHSEAG